ncbi:hypothetical protein EPO04_03785 [Patescibacteria group bacterium]|nr:MAG: hypothetical protein EPO04_03785 [Patescibacteria group bacterium]
MSPEKGPGPEDRDLIPGSEEVELEDKAREEGRLQRIAGLEERLEEAYAGIEEVRGSELPDAEKSKRILQFEDEIRNLERQLDELERTD